MEEVVLDSIRIVRNPDKLYVSVVKTNSKPDQKERVMPSTMDGTFDGVVDANHNDDIVLNNLQAAGIVAVIHKASEGATFQDPMYSQRRYEARALGMLWGAYHFSSGGPPQDQADNFISALQWSVDPDFDATTLLCLDFENSTSGPDMSIEGACTFVTPVHQRTGRWPLVYGSNLVSDADAHATLPCPLTNCPLWYANYNDQPKQVPSRIWTSLALWQYSDGCNGPPPQLAGLDRSCYLGTEAALQAAWPLA